MKQIRKLTAHLLAALLCVSMLTGCGGSGMGGSKGQAATGGAYEQPAAMPEEEIADFDTEWEESKPGEMDLGDITEDSATGASGESVYDRTDVKLIRNASLTVEALDFDAACVALEALVSQCGGYLEDTNVFQGSYGSTYRSANYTVRVPAEQYDSFLKGVDHGELFHVSEKSESTQDVGNEYADTETRLQTMKNKLKRLNELLTQAKNMEDIITIESAIADTEASIEKYSAKLTRYDRLIGYATIRVFVEQVRSLTETEADPFLQRLGSSFVEGARSFVKLAQDLAIWLAGNILLLLVLVILLLALMRLLSRAQTRPASLETGTKKKPFSQKKEKKTSEPAENQEKNQ